MALITTPGYQESLNQVAEATQSGRSTVAATSEAPAMDLVLDSASNSMLCAGEWTAKAMCKGKTALFFAPPGEREGRRRRREALANAYCAVCPVQSMCQAAGREGREHGIWGGESDEARAHAGHAPRSPHRRAVAQAAREARLRAEAAETA